MANEKNLIPQAHTLTLEEQSAGGKKSGQVRREKKTIQKILNDLLEGDIEKNPQFAKLAAKMGIKSPKSIKDMFTILCLINSAKKGDLSELEKLSRLIGEAPDASGADDEKQEELLNAIERAVRNAD